jgi:hypothetical protein
VAGDEAFDEWLQSIELSSDGDDRIPGDVEAWLRELYARRGAIDRRAVHEASRAVIADLVSRDGTWTRIADDLRRTAARELRLEPVPDECEDVFWLSAAVFVDDRHVLTFGHRFSPAIEQFVAELADYLQESALDREVWGGWPICADHNTHPLHAMLDAGRACWVCPVTNRRVAVIGDLLPKPA